MERKLILFGLKNFPQENSKNATVFPPRRHKLKSIKATDFEARLEATTDSEPQVPVTYPTLGGRYKG